MLNKRIVPCLILNDDKLIHRSQFDNTTDRYIGDPINAVNIFNDYTVDEMFVIDITSTLDKREINFKLLEDIAGEAFFPLAYGGGVKNSEHAEKIINIGYEKIIINSESIRNPYILKEISKSIGAQSIVVSIDIICKKENFYIFDHINKKSTNIDIKEHIELIQKIGVGEILITMVNLDGTMKGPNLNIIRYLNNYIQVPLIYKGGASSFNDIKKIIDSEVNVFTSSTIFIMKKLNGGIVFNYPSENEKIKYGIL